MIKPSLSIVIPVFNESSTIVAVLEELRTELLQIDMLEHFEIICVDDASSDESAKIVQNMDYVKLYKNKKNRGYGFSLKQGIIKAQYEYVLIMDSDGQHDPKYIHTMLSMIINEGYHMVVGARPVTNTKKRRVLGKILIHKLATYLVKEDIPDINSGFRIFRKDIANRYLHMCSDRFSFTTSITLAFMQDGLDIGYFPIHARQRAGGKSSVNFKSGFRAVLKILQIVMIFNPLRILLPTSFLLAFILLLSLVEDVYEFNISDTTVMLSVSTLILFVFSLVADQISHIRKEINSR